MATLVTGGAGFVGSNIVKGLAAEGHRVVCFDVSPADALLRDYLEPWSDSVTYVQGDILNVDDLRRTAAQHPIDKIVHAAVFTPSQTGPMETERSRDIVNINIEGTANLLDLAAAATTTAAVPSHTSHPTSGKSIATFFLTPCSNRVSTVHA